MAQSDYLRQLMSASEEAHFLHGVQTDTKYGEKGTIGLPPPSEASIRANPDEYPLPTGPLRPISSSALPHQKMDDLSLESREANSRKRQASSDIHMPDSPPLGTASPQNVSQVPAGSLRRSTEVPTNPVLPRKTQRPHDSRSGALGQFISPQHGRKLSTPHIGSHRKRASASTATTWSKWRPKGPNTSVNDCINTLYKLFPAAQLSSGSISFSRSTDETEFDDSETLITNAGMVKQPDSRPISQSQLAAEVKGIYSGLVMVENKCVNVVNAQNQAMQQAESGDEQAQYSLKIDHFQALIALHRTLLHEHHDFFHASQHPSAGPAIRDLALRYSMPARMWKHGIHNFLELLRHRLPESLDYMLAFIYLAYQMMALLYETVDSFEETWIECLGDLGRYRMAIEDEDLRDREVWTGVARFWYMKAVDKNPGIGRLYHHLAILARTQPLQQVSSYCRSLTAVQPFMSSRESILTLLEPTIARFRNSGSKTPSFETCFVTSIACTFRVPSTAEFQTKPLSMFLDQLDAHILKSGTKWCESGAYIATAIIGSLLKFGCTDSQLRSHFAPEEKPSSRPPAPEPKRDERNPDPDDLLELFLETGVMPHEWSMLFETLRTVLKRVGDTNVLSFLHIVLVFCWRLTLSPGGSDYLNGFLPLELMCTYLNKLEELPAHFPPKSEELSFPSTPHNNEQPLPEDFLIRGQVYSEGVFPASWFENASSDIDERVIEQPYMSKRRALRVKWLAIRFAAAQDTSSTLRKDSSNVPVIDDNTVPTHRSPRKWMRWDPSTDTFSVVSDDVSGGRTQTLDISKDFEDNDRLYPSVQSDTYKTTKLKR